jgi:hypothetical protein
MKKLLFTIAGILLNCSIGLVAQDATPKLNQLKLMQGLWVGKVQHAFSEDSVEVSETIQFGNSFEYKTYLVVNGKQSFLNGGSFIYSPKEDKFKGFVYRPSGNYQTWIGSFTTETRLSIDIVLNFNPEKVLIKEVVESENPTNYTATFYNLDGTIRGEYKYTRETR